MAVVGLLGLLPLGALAHDHAHDGHAPSVADVIPATPMPPAAGLGPTTWVLAAFVVLLTLAAMTLARRHAREGAGEDTPTDLLQIRWLRRGLLSGKLQLALQVPMLVVTVAVVLLGLFDVQNGALNVATRLTWTIWWAGVIFTFVLVGRAWCLACPFGALNEWTSRLLAPSRRLPRAFRNIWWATGIFVVLTWTDEQLGVVRSPRVTAGLILTLVGAAVAIGVRYERRSFCRYLCPISGVIGLYSMTAPLELRVRDGALCRTHAEKACYRGGATTRGCPMFEFPQAMDRNTYCNLCGQCAASCSRDNLVLRLRTAGTDLWASRHHVLDEAYLALVLVGLTLVVTAQMLPAWSDWASGLAEAVLPDAGTGPTSPTRVTVVESVIVLGVGLVVAPLLLVLAAPLTNRLAGAHQLGRRRTFTRFGYMFVPIGLGMHLAHNLNHLLVEGPSIVPAIQRAALLYTPFFLGAPDWSRPPAVSGAVVELLQMAVLVGALVMALVAGYRISWRAFPDAGKASWAFAPMATLALFFIMVGIVLLSLP